MSLTATRRLPPERGVVRPAVLPATSANTVELIIRLRKQLSEQGLDAGPDTIACTRASTTSSSCRERRSAAT